MPSALPARHIASRPSQAETCCFHKAAACERKSAFVNVRMRYRVSFGRSAIAAAPAGAARHSDRWYRGAALRGARHAGVRVGRALLPQARCGVLDRAGPGPAPAQDSRAVACINHRMRAAPATAMADCSTASPFPMRPPRQDRPEARRWPCRGRSLRPRSRPSHCRRCA